MFAICGKIVKVERLISLDPSCNKTDDSRCLLLLGNEVVWPFIALQLFVLLTLYSLSVFSFRYYYDGRQIKKLP